HRAAACLDPPLAFVPDRSDRSWVGSPGPAPACVASSVRCPCSFLPGPCGRRRISIRYLQHPLFFDALQAPLQKIDLQRLLTDLALQFCNASFRLAPLPVSVKGVARSLTNLPPPAILPVWCDFLLP